MRRGPVVHYDQERRSAPAPPAGAADALNDPEDDMSVEACAGLARRLREVHEDLYGPHGAQFLADALGRVDKRQAKCVAELTQQDHDSSYMDESEEVCVRLLIAGRDPAVLLH